MYCITGNFYWQYIEPSTTILNEISVSLVKVEQLFHFGRS